MRNIDAKLDCDVMVERIKKFLCGKWLGSTIVYKEEMDSTNVQAKILAQEGADDGTVVLTRSQTAGKGRLGRNWISPRGNIYMSIILRPDIHTEYASSVTLIVALALVKAIQQMTSLDAMIKWPNDIVINRKKTCGILTESSVKQGKIDYIIVGVGINLNQRIFDESIKEMATSLYVESGKKYDEAQLIATFLKYLEQFYESFLETEDLSLVKDIYNERLINMGKEVRIIDKEKEQILIARGIDEQGRLMVENQFGNIEVIAAGEVSVRGLYGYV